MIKLNSLRSRLIAVYLGLIIVGFGGLTLWAGQQIAQSTMDDFGNGLQIHALSLAATLAEPLEEEPAAVLPNMERIAVALGGEVSLYSINNQLQAATDPTTIGLIPTTSYLVRNNQNGEPTVYVNTDVLHETETLGIIQLEVPATQPQTTIRQRWTALGAGFLAFSILGIVTSLWLLTTITRPLTHLRQTALNMADGNLKERVTELPENEIGAVGNAFNLMAQQVEEMVTEQRAFASNASHELRTPLTTIQLRTEAIQEGTLETAVQQQYIAEIESEVKHMGKLVEDLMMLSRIDANRLETGNEPIDAGRLLNILAKEFAQKAAAKTIDFTVNVATESVIVAANSNHLRVVYRNVIDNALKYTQSGGSVTAVLSLTDQVAQLKVIDNGQGIAQENLGRIGQRFYRTDKAHSREVPGTGLGLAMVHSITKLYDGKVTIESEGLGLGTAVTIQWPLYK